MSLSLYTFYMKLFFATLIGLLFMTSSVAVFVGASADERPSHIWEIASVVASCLHFDSLKRLDCYQIKVPDLYPKLTISEVFSVLLGIQRIDSAAYECHVLAHRMASVVVSNDPSRWQQLMTEGPQEGMCGYGFMHGIQVAAFRGLRTGSTRLEKTDRLLATLCQNSATTTFTYRAQAACFHGLGHILYYTENQDVSKAAKKCEKLVPENESFPYEDMKATCYDGVLMRLFFPEEKEDFEEPMPYRLTRDTAPAFCQGLAGDRLTDSCLIGMRFMMIDDIQKGRGVDDFCNALSNPSEVNICYRNFQKLNVFKHLANPRVATYACTQLLPERRSDCFATSARNILYHGGGTAGMPGALATCALAPESMRAHCYKSVAQDAPNYSTPGTEKRTQFCKKLTAPYQETCMTIRSVL